MRALIIYRVDISEASNQGVSKKMQGHLQGLILNSYQTDVIYLSSEGLYFNEKIFNEVPLRKWRRLWYKAKTFYRAISNHVKIEEYDLLLIRFNLVFPGLLRMLESFKKRNPKLKIIMDLPTFPYDQEWRGFKGKIALKIDDRNRENLKKFVDLMIHYGNESEIFGIKCHTASNGILPLVKDLDPKKTKSQTINLLAVGKWRSWHGVDRLIMGMAKAKDLLNKENVMLHVIGDGPALAEYQDLVKKENLKQYVEFYGPKSGTDLDVIFQLADIGIGTLAIQRKGVAIDSSLKHREYCIRGIPFILAAPDLDFPQELDFVQYFPGEESISIKELLSFVIKLKQNKIQRADIQNYAMKNLSWKRKVRELLEAIE